MLKSKNYKAMMSLCRMSPHPNYGVVTRPQCVNLRSKIVFKLYSSSSDDDGEITEEDSQVYSASFSSARTQLNLLDQLKSSASSSSSSSSADGSGSGEYDSSSSRGLTIRDQLAQLVADLQLGSPEFTIPLGKNLKKVSPKFLNISQKRNIKRQDYLNQVSARNDSTFFATIGAFVILPPIIILGIAVATGYVQLLP